MAFDSVNPAAVFQAKAGFVHRKVAGTDVLISVGENVANFNGYVELNPSAAWIWDQLQQPRTQEQLADGLAQAFGIDLDLAARDTLAFLSELREHNMVVVA